MKKILFYFIFFLSVFPITGSAQTNVLVEDKVYTCRVVEILEEKFSVIDGKDVKQQKLKLLILDGDKKGQAVVFNGIANYDLIKKNIYKIDEKVIVVATYNNEGEATYYITDYYRNGPLIILSVVFLLALLAVGRSKGIRSVLSLILSFIVIIYYLIPSILAGSNPVIVSVIGSIIILFSVIYITEGFKIRSHVAVLSLFLTLFITLLISWFFVEISYLSGISSEEIAYLVNIGDIAINFKGLLLAGIIIGTLGVMDDIVISQIVSVEQIINIKNDLSKSDVFKKAFKIGISHISSMINTLFLAYTGASLPLLILFISGKSAFGSWGQVVNNEAIATEIIRTLTGSIGLILAVPISTFLAVYFFNKKK